MYGYIVPADVALDNYVAQVSEACYICTYIIGLL